MVQRKPDDERINRNPRVFPTTTIIWDGKTRGMPLPEDEEWTPQTQKWWNFVRNSPQAMLMQDSDWQTLLLAAKIHHQMYATKVATTKSGAVMKVPITPGELRGLAAEFRTYIDTYGFTRQSRIRYGINIIDPEEAETEASQALIKNAQVTVGYRERFKDGG